MTLENKLNNLLQKKAIDVVPFVKSLSEEEKENIRPLLLQYNKEYLPFNYDKIPGSKKYIGRKATDQQKYILNTLSMLCLTEDEFEQDGNVWDMITDLEVFEQAFVYKPVPWVKRFVEQRNWPQFGYLFLLRMDKKKLLKIRYERLIERLESSTSSEIGDRRFKKYTPLINLHSFPETLEKHIWDLFQYETNIHHSDYNKYKKDGKELPFWKGTFQELIEEGKLDRMRLLKEALAASNRNFNKRLSTWFMDLFVFLAPNTQELLTLQPELFATLHCPHSKVVNSVLKIIKDLYKEKDFQTQDFLDLSDILLNSETKSVANSSLMIFDKLLRKDKSLARTLTLKSAIALANPHKAIQERAAKFIVKNDKDKSEELLAEINTYAADLLVDGKKILKDYLQEDSTAEAIAQEKDVVVDLNLEETQKIRPIETMDDFVFLGSQVFENNEIYHVDLFLSALLRFKKQLTTSNNINKIELVFQKAYDIVVRGQWQNSFLSELLGHCLLEISQQLMQQYPNETATLEKLQQVALKKQAEFMSSHTNYQPRIKPFSEYQPQYWFCSAYKHLIQNFFSLYQNEQDINLLSTPTHSPFWIDPLTLAERVANYQSKKVDFLEMDFAFAIARCHLKDTTAALAYTKKNIEGEAQKILLYLFDEKVKLKKSDKTKKLWIQAALTKNNTPEISFEEMGKTFPNINICKGDIEWLTEHYQTQERVYSGAIQKRVLKTVWKTSFFIWCPVSQTKTDIVNDIKTYKEREMEMALGIFDHLNWPLTYAYFRTDRISLFSFNKDVKHMFTLLPNNPEMYFYWVIKNAIWHRMPEVAEDRTVTQSIEVLFDTYQPLGNIAHVFLALAFMYKDKTVRSLVAEFWIRAVQTQQIDVTQLGHNIGKIERVEWLPLKRFTDVAMQQLLNISPQHNRALETMLTHCILAMGDKPIKNTKKLLELYTELLHLNKSQITDSAIVGKLEKWQSSPSLKKPIKGLLAN